MKEYYINTSELRDLSAQLCAGDKVYLSGCVYTARDAAHKRMFELLNRGEDLPFKIEDSVVYYAGPTPTPPGLPIGSCGPTTSSRMDRFAPALYSLGMCATVGKGDRSSDVYDAIVKNQGVYLCAIGGAGALEAILTVLAIKEDIVPPTINHVEGDEDEKIDYKLNFTFNKAQKRVINAAISNTFGFGGHNTSIAFKKIK